MEIRSVALERVRLTFLSHLLKHIVNLDKLLQVVCRGTCNQIQVVVRGQSHSTLILILQASLTRSQ